MAQQMQKIGIGRYLTISNSVDPHYYNVLSNVPKHAHATATTMTIERFMVDSAPGQGRWMAVLFPIEDGSNETHPAAAGR